VASGSYNYTKAINPNHPDGDKIKLLGNPSNPENRILNFSNVRAGIDISNSNKIGLILGFKIIEDNTANCGIYATKNSCLTISNTIIQGFVSVGYIGIQANESTVYISSYFK
jgi:hypothetical protein